MSNANGRTLPPDLANGLTKAMIAVHRYYCDELDARHPEDPEGNWRSACVLVLRACMVNTHFAARVPADEKADQILRFVVEQALTLTFQELNRNKD